MQAFNDKPGQHDTFEEHTAKWHSLWFYFFFVFTVQYDPAAFSKGFATYAQTCISHENAKILPFKQSFIGQNTKSSDSSVSAAKAALQSLSPRQVKELRQDPTLHHVWDPSRGDHDDSLMHHTSG
eukprot:TRINITY_DN28698_c0_g1_i1.p1 TRINITY_DN28698_c0_g1~~TRINITY_DN28698_c0_g1_i1.p1  ORF type:complete len:125 (+),score=32.72 TRINITY_DN28698_c0_g1_i1:215-589(+)